MRNRDRKKKLSERTTKIIDRNTPGKIFRKAFLATYFTTAAIGGIYTISSACNEPEKMEIENAKKGEKNRTKKGEFKKPKKLSEAEKKKLNKELLNAANIGDAKEAERLLYAGADIEAKTSMGWTPLMMAAGDITTDEVVKLLVKEGADVSVSNDNGTTPLMIAARNGRISNVKLLISSGADIHAEDKNGKTALDKAKQTGMMKTVEVLENYE